MASRAGRPNRNKQGLLARLQQEFPNYHPILELARVANDPEVDLSTRVNANKEIAKYVTPQLKAVEHTGPDGERLQTRVIITFDQPAPPPDPAPPLDD
jgi:hypothetical protein